MHLCFACSGLGDDAVEGEERSTRDTTDTPPSAVAMRSVAARFW